MPRAKNKQGQFARYGDRLTTYRGGTVGSQDDRARTEMFIDCSHYFSLSGFGLHHDTKPEERSRMAAKNPRAHVTSDPSHTPAIQRSGGRSGSGNPHSHSGGPTADRGAPPVFPSHRWGIGSHPGNNREKK